jgi:hypothetical protein
VTGCSVTRSISTRRGLRARHSEPPGPAASPGWRRPSGCAAARLETQAVVSALCEILEPCTRRSPPARARAPTRAGAPSPTTARRGAARCRLRGVSRCRSLSATARATGGAGPRPTGCDSPAVAALRRSTASRSNGTRGRNSARPAARSRGARGAPRWPRAGLYTDLALGSDGGGGDAWSREHRARRARGSPTAFARRAGLELRRSSHALRRESFAFWKRLLGANLPRGRADRSRARSRRLF